MARLKRLNVVITDVISRVLQYLHGLEGDRQRDDLLIFSLAPRACIWAESGATVACDIVIYYAGPLCC